MRQGLGTMKNSPSGYRIVPFPKLRLRVADFLSV